MREAVCPHTVLLWSGGLLTVNQSQRRGAAIYTPTPPLAYARSEQDRAPALSPPGYPVQTNAQRSGRNHRGSNLYRRLDLGAVSRTSKEPDDASLWLEQYSITTNAIRRRGLLPGSHVLFTQSV